MAPFNTNARPGKLCSAFEQLFVLLLLLSSMNVITALTPSSKEQTELKAFSAANVDMTSVAIEAGLYAYGSILLLMRWRRVLRAARRVWPLVALAVLACISTIWSVQPMVTLRRSVLLLAGTMFAIYIGERYSIEAFARLLARTMCWMMMLILLLYFVAPAYVVDSAYGGAWKGLSAYKNTFGEHMAVALVLLVLVRFHRFSWVRYVFLPIAAGLLFLSHSATALVCGLLAIAAIPLWRLMRGERRVFVCVLVALAFFLGMFWILTFPDLIFQILGRDATLTGRTRLWTLLFPVIANRPILGYGYGAFWTGLQAEVLTVWIRAGRLVPVADNGYIDLCLSLGAAGLSLFLYMFIGAFRKAMLYVRSQPGIIGVWPVIYLCIFAADNISESALLTRGTFPFLVFAILTTSLSMQHKHAVTTAQTIDDRSFLWGWNSPAISR